MYLPKRAGLAIGLASGLAVWALAASPAKAWWVRPAVVVVAPPPPYYAPPPRLVYAPYPYHHFVRAHYDWRGVFIPGHWV